MLFLDPRIELGNLGGSLRGLLHRHEGLQCQRPRGVEIPGPDGCVEAVQRGAAGRKLFRAVDIFAGFQHALDRLNARANRVRELPRDLA